MFTWKDSYSVHIKKIDQQHKKLFSIFDELHNAMRSSGGEEELSKILDECSNYIGVHFRFEEGLLKKARYSDLNMHVEKHHLFEKTIMDKINRIKGDNYKTSDILTMYGFLSNWLKEHILKTDQKYGPETKQFHDC